VFKPTASIYSTISALVFDHGLPSINNWLTDELFPCSSVESALQDINSEPIKRMKSCLIKDDFMMIVLCFYKTSNIIKNVINKS